MPAQLDRVGATNLSYVGGSYESPRVALPGSRGLPDNNDSPSRVWYLVPDPLAPVPWSSVSTSFRALHLLRVEPAGSSHASESLPSKPTAVGRRSVCSPVWTGAEVAAAAGFPIQVPADTEDDCRAHDDRTGGAGLRGPRRPALDRVLRS